MSVLNVPGSKTLWSGTDNVARIPSFSKIICGPTRLTSQPVFRNAFTASRPEIFRGSFDISNSHFQNFNISGIYLPTLCSFIKNFQTTYNCVLNIFQCLFYGSSLGNASGNSRTFNNITGYFSFAHNYFIIHNFIIPKNIISKNFMNVKRKKYTRRNGGDAGKASIRVCLRNDSQFLKFACILFLCLIGNFLVIRPLM